MNTHDVILPVCCFGNVFFYSEYLKAGAPVLDACENYPKQTYRNRYEILGPNGMQGLTVPVVGQKGKKTPVKEIEIDYREDWPIIHWRSLVTAYRSSPFFEFYEDELREILFERPEKLIDLNLKSHRQILEWLGVDEKGGLADSYVRRRENQKDLRDAFKPSKSGQQFKSYLQVFSDRHKFVNNLTVLDLLFNLGPESSDYLFNC